MSTFYISFSLPWDSQSLASNFDHFSFSLYSFAASVSSLLHPLARAIAFVINVFIQKADIEYFWISQIVKSIPSLLFLTAYSFLLHFLALISSQEEKSSNLSKPLLLGLNILSYLGFTFIAIYCKLYFYLTSCRLKRENSRVPDFSVWVLWHYLSCVFPVCFPIWHKDFFTYFNKKETFWHCSRELGG